MSQEVFASIPQAEAPDRVPIIILRFFALISRYKATHIPLNLIEILKYHRDEQNSQAYYKDIQTECEGDVFLGIRYDFMEAKGIWLCFRKEPIIHADIVAEWNTLRAEKGDPLIQVDKTPYQGRLTLGRYRALRKQGETCSQQTLDNNLSANDPMQRTNQFGTFQHRGSVKNYLEQLKSLRIKKVATVEVKAKAMLMLMLTVTVRAHMATHRLWNRRVRQRMDFDRGRKVEMRSQLKWVEPAGAAMKVTSTSRVLAVVIARKMKKPVPQL